MRNAQNSTQGRSRVRSTYPQKVSGPSLMPTSKTGEKKEKKASPGGLFRRGKFTAIANSGKRGKSFKIQQPKPRSKKRAAVAKLEELRNQTKTQAKGRKSRLSSGSPSGFYQQDGANKERTSHYGTGEEKLLTGRRSDASFKKNDWVQRGRSPRNFTKLLGSDQKQGKITKEDATGLNGEPWRTNRRPSKWFVRSLCLLGGVNAWAGTKK